MDEIKQAMTALGKANVIGMVLNNSGKKRGRFGALVHGWKIA